MAAGARRVGKRLEAKPWGVRTWLIRIKGAGESQGEVRWFAHWGSYVFCAYGDRQLSGEDLRDIADFLDSMLSDERRER